MFNKLKQLKDLRNKAKEMQNILEQETVSVEKKGVKITMSGNMEIKSVEITGDLNKEKIEKGIQEAVNSAIKKTQKMMASKMQEMGGFPGLG